MAFFEDWDYHFEGVYEHMLVGAIIRPTLTKKYYKCAMRGCPAKYFINQYLDGRSSSSPSNTMLYSLLDPLNNVLAVNTLLSCPRDWENCSRGGTKFWGWMPHFNHKVLDTTKSNGSSKFYFKSKCFEKPSIVSIVVKIAHKRLEVFSPHGALGSLYGDALLWQHMIIHFCIWPHQRYCRLDIVVDNILVDFEMLLAIILQCTP